MARAAGGRFLLRIEDIDTLRCTPELTEAMLMDLAWIGLRWEEPVLRQSEHFSHYHAAQQALRDRGLLYPCFCSRNDIAAEGPGRDPESQPLYSGLAASCRTPRSSDASSPANSTACVSI